MLLIIAMNLNPWRQEAPSAHQLSKTGWMEWGDFNIDYKPKS